MLWRMPADFPLWKDRHHVRAPRWSASSASTRWCNIAPHTRRHFRAYIRCTKIPGRRRSRARNVISCWRP